MVMICATCNQPMVGTSCTDQRAWPFGGEPWGDDEPVTRTCRDCGTIPYGNHHLGCLHAFCRVCEDQLPACDGHRLLN